MFLESRFEQEIDRIARRAAIPLRLELWNGRRIDLSSRPTVTVAIPRRSALQYFVAPDLSKLGEAFVEGHIRVKGPIHEVFKVGESLARTLGASTPARWHRMLHHSRTADRKAIEHHYDVSNEFYSLFLDRDMVYSCAYFDTGNETLEDAQLRKLDHILAKLRLKPGERFLDIGCGWGALILRAAQHFGAIATGITISRNQFDYARERIRAADLEGRCSVELRDYRDMAGAREFDKIASVGMFEHVGQKNLARYFSTMRSLLGNDGLVINHGISRSDIDRKWMPLGAGEFIDRYVFPEGELPHVSQVLEQMARAGLEVVDVESLRRHYALTCHEWASRLEAAKERAVRIAGERRVRIWEIYLAGSAYGFARGWMNVYQILACSAANPEAKQLPLTRDYMYAREGESARRA